MTGYLIDTSVWIEFFRGRKEGIKKRILELLDHNRIFTNGIVIAELLVGSSGKREINFVKENLLKLNYLDTGMEFFFSCGEMGNQLRQAGISVPFSDLVIATHAKQHRLIVLTLDQHYESIGLCQGVRFEILKNF